MNEKAVAAQEDTLTLKALDELSNVLSNIQCEKMDALKRTVAPYSIRVAVGVDCAAPLPWDEAQESQVLNTIGYLTKKARDISAELSSVTDLVQ